MFITPQFLKTYVKLRDMGEFIYRFNASLCTIIELYQFYCNTFS